MEIDLNRTALDLNDPTQLETLFPMLANLQGNILKPHGRNHAINLFLEFHDNQVDVKKWISTFTGRYITSAARQHHEAKEFKENGISGHLFASLYLTADGYRILGLDDLKQFDESELNSDVGFTSGMKSEKCREKLKDPQVADWEPNYQKTIHAMILLADNNEQRLQDVAKRIVDSLGTAGQLSFEEKGFVLRGKNKEPKEHFGFRDGISQPLFFKEDINSELPVGIDVLNPALKWNPSAPLKLVLIKDPFAAPANCFGSFLVYRKLEQNVALFLEKEEQLVAQLGLEENKERAEALIVGRFRNGMPAMVYDKTAPLENANLNNFNYKHDDKTRSNRTHSRCPYHAHIRKTNPRGDFILGPTIHEDERSKRIARRGINYDGRPPEVIEVDNKPSEGAGLLFMCFQSSISKQFAFMQSDWVHNQSFPSISEINPALGILSSRPIGSDPILDSAGAGKDQRWCPAPDKDDDVEFHFSDVVKFKGGQFFFAPSIFFLRNLAPVSSEEDPSPNI